MTTKFETFHIMSISTEMHIKNINYEEMKFDLNVYIIPGLIEYQKDNSLLFNNIDYFMLVYDVTSKKSFDIAVNIVEDLKKKYIRNNNTYIIGNKCDLKYQSVDMNNVNKFCNDNKFNKFEVSAKNNTNVNNLINHIIEKHYNGLS
jgi:GTPase SAR1 family protein